MKLASAAGADPLGSNLVPRLSLTDITRVALHEFGQGASAMQF
jgi:hypothetical protein